MKNVALSVPKKGSVPSRRAAMRRQSVTSLDLSWQHAHGWLNVFVILHMFLDDTSIDLGFTNTFSANRWIHIWNPWIMKVDYIMSWHPFKIGPITMHANPSNPLSWLPSLRLWEASTAKALSKDISACMTYLELNPRSPRHSWYPFYHIFVGPNTTVLTCWWGSM